MRAKIYIHCPVGFFKLTRQHRIMEFKRIKEEKAVDTVIEALKSGNHRKAKVRLGEIKRPRK